MHIVTAFVNNSSRRCHRTVGFWKGAREDFAEKVVHKILVFVHAMRHNYYDVKSENLMLGPAALITPVREVRGPRP